MFTKTTVDACSQLLIGQLQYYSEMPALMETNRVAILMATDPFIFKVSVQAVDKHNGFVPSSCSWQPRLHSDRHVHIVWILVIIWLVHNCCISIGWGMLGTKCQSIGEVPQQKCPWKLSGVFSSKKWGISRSSEIIGFGLCPGVHASGQTHHLQMPLEHTIVPWLLSVVDPSWQLWGPLFLN